MSFKRLALLVLVGLGMGCGLKVGEKAPVDPPIVVNGEPCLGEVSNRINKFLDGELSDGEVRKAVGCIRKSFESFARHTRGLDRNSFAPQEIRAFLHKYFVRDKQISDKLLNDLMIIKQTCVGGPIDKVTRNDLAKVIETLNFIEEQAVKLNPYMGVLNFSAVHMQSSDLDQLAQLNLAVNTFTQVISATGQRLANANSPYPLPHLESFMRELRDFSGWEEVASNSRDPKLWVALIGSVKSVLTGHNSDVINPRDWPVIFSQAAGWYGIYLKLALARDQKSLLSGTGFNAVTQIGNDIERQLRTAVNAQPDKVLRYSEIDRVLNAMDDLNLPPFTLKEEEGAGDRKVVRVESIKKAVRAIFDRIVGDPRVGWKSRQSQGIDNLAINRMVAEFSRWVDIQKLLIKKYPNQDAGPRVETFSEKLGPLGASRVLMDLMNGSPEDMAISSLRQIEQKLRPLFRDGDNMVFLTEKSQLPKYGVAHGFQNLSRMNVIRGLISLLMNGYSSYRDGNGMFDVGITGEELQAFYMDFRELGVDLNIMDPRNANSGLVRFREANLFTYSGNGVVAENRAATPMDAKLTFMELMEYTAFIASGGGLAESIYDAMTNEANGVCRKQGGAISRDAGLWRPISRKCFRDNLLQVLTPRLASMPVMQETLKRTTGAAREDLLASLTDTLYVPGRHNPEFIEWQELTVLAVILHYTEAVMTRYNEDQDEELNTQEVWAAFETFKGYMGELYQKQCRAKVWDWVASVGCGQGVGEMYASSIFAYVVEKGTQPGFIDLWSFPRTYGFRKQFHVNRIALLKVFATLIKTNEDSSQKSSTATPISN